MHIAEVVTIAKSLPLLRLNTYKSLILSYSADYRRIFEKKPAIDANFVNDRQVALFLILYRIYVNLYPIYIPSKTDFNAPSIRIKIKYHFIVLLLNRQFFPILQNFYSTLSFLINHHCQRFTK